MKGACIELSIIIIGSFVIYSTFNEPLKDEKVIDKFIEELSKKDAYEIKRNINKVDLIIEDEKDIFSFLFYFIGGLISVFAIKILDNNIYNILLLNNKINLGTRYVLTVVVAIIVYLIVWKYKRKKLKSNIDRKNTLEIEYDKKIKKEEDEKRRLEHERNQMMDIAINNIKNNTFFGLKEKES